MKSPKESGRVECNYGSPPHVVTSVRGQDAAEDLARTKGWEPLLMGRHWCCPDHIPFDRSKG